MGGNNCSKCGVSMQSGDRNCRSCRQRESPSCGYCGKPILPMEEAVKGMHKFPCYGQRTSKCCECNGAVDYSVNASYCRNCYDSKYPPPLKIHARQNDNEVKIYMRDDEFNNPSVQRLAEAFGRGLASGGQENRFLMDH